MEGLKHVLIVDDEPDIVSLLGVILKKTKKYKVSGASDGKKALEFMSNDKTVDLVLADIKMPEMSGIELIEKIRELDVEFPKVVFVTGFTDLPLEELYDYGACDFVAKPFDWEKIISTVEQCLKPKPVFNNEYNESDIKNTIETELESIEAAQAFSEDLKIGWGGFFVTTQHVFIVRDLVRFRITFNGGEIKELKGIGQIIWQKISESNDAPNLIGVKFFNIDNETEDFVESFCRKQKVKAYIPKR